MRKLAYYFLAALFLFFALSYEGIKYRIDFFSIKYVSPKMDTTMCDHKIGLLSRKSKHYFYFLLDQMMNDKEIGFYYYPVQYRYADIANYILTLEYGTLQSYIAEIDFEERGKLERDNRALLDYYRDIREKWAFLYENKKLTTENAICR